MNREFFANNEMPAYLKNFLIYMETIKGHSSKTALNYFYDLRAFLRFIKLNENPGLNYENFDDIKISDVDIKSIKNITLNDLYSYMAYINADRENIASSRARKVSSLKTFFKYLHSKANLIDADPTVNLDSPKIGKRLPKYLDLNSSVMLLDAADEVNNKRDVCMLTILLNCGLRVSELVGININDIKGTRLSVLGKGNKERTIYLNKACIDAINEYMEVRPKDGVKDRKALFLNRFKDRITTRGVQNIVKKYIEMAGLDSSKYSTHKLRHTAATLMYKHGKVDILALQHILGHENLSTTQIYTHVDDEQLKDAVDQNPLAKRGKKNHG